jgi:hypothetical protein
MADFWSDLLGAGKEAANDAVTQVTKPATDAITQGTEMVSRAADTQAALLRLDKNVENLKPVIWAALIVSGVSLAIIAWKQFR